MAGVSTAAGTVGITTSITIDRKSLLVSGRASRQPERRSDQSLPVWEMRSSLMSTAHQPIRCCPPERLPCEGQISARKAAHGRFWSDPSRTSRTGRQLARIPQQPTARISAPLCSLNQQAGYSRLPGHRAHSSCGTCRARSIESRRMRRTSVCRWAEPAAARNNTKCRPLRSDCATCNVSRPLPISGRALVRAAQDPLSMLAPRRKQYPNRRAPERLQTARESKAGWVQIRLDSAGKPHGPCARPCAHKNSYRSGLFANVRSRTLPRCRPRSAALPNVQ